MINLVTKEMNGVLEVLVPGGNTQIFGYLDRGLVVDENNGRLVDVHLEVRQHVLDEKNFTSCVSGGSVLGFGG
eukprot:CAMPEP_0184376664 /NCGR_PEP_ID=MMETSP0007-20130409/1639_1 /TAXON_ID=97485 /ORGANISM="Prymnesium parvum, Strain Texoma1" /LENGTH=72 /DNA_ID=CAMNT_0026720287 /DNA_START=503 /DNA_END=721 /DNA_ORIENTATION=+